MLGRRFAFTTTESWKKSGTAARSPGIILAYHRVTNLATDPQMLAVTPANFAEQLAILREHFNLITLREMTQRLATGQPIAGCVALTFDDGYADNLYEAKPLLERHLVPATVFIASNHIGASAEFWWDELERLLLQPGTLPSTLTLAIGNREYSWQIDDDADYGPAAFERNRDWNVTQSKNISGRHVIYRALHGQLGLLSTRQREQALDSLRRWANTSSTARATHRTVTATEVIALAAGDCVEIGAHTASHPVLSMLTEKEQEIEIRRSTHRLAEIIGKPIKSFAFPYGSLTDYGGETVRLVKAMNFDCACSTFPDVVRQGCDRFQLPRFMVRDWNGEEFLRRLRMWMQR
jgi:peptidoglycan/xylan/chitin deacetylase (PgdA/CDA1 family)